eukprot:7530431-Ditylum_brightwellii.AAC.1
MMQTRVMQIFHMPSEEVSSRGHLFSWHLLDTFSTAMITPSDVPFSHMHGVGVYFHGAIFCAGHPQLMLMIAVPWQCRGDREKEQNGNL